MDRMIFVALACSVIANAQNPAGRQFKLTAESPKFWQLIAKDARLEKVAGGFGFTEGPVWNPRGFLYFSDSNNNKVLRVYPGGRVETVLEIGDPDGSTFDAQGRFVTTARFVNLIWPLLMLSFGPTRSFV
jgi:gluconolactonase